MNYILLLLSISALANDFSQIPRPMAIKTLTNKFVNSNIYKPKINAVDFSNVTKALSKKRRIDSRFPISSNFLVRTKFWLYIYGELDSKSIIVHDKKDLSKIYAQFNFEKLWNSKQLTALEKSIIQADLAQKEATIIKRLLLDCNKKLLKKNYKFIINEDCKDVQALANKIRIQTGKKDVSRHTITRYNEIQYFLSDLHSTFQVPNELDGIAFLESSFVVNARSHANAVGIWQFMKRTSNHFMPKITKYLDHRLNPYIASLGAFHLIKQNYKILKSWELAIPAYNFGVHQILLAKRSLKKENLSLDYLFKHYKSNKLGFASRNYYGNFLAAAHLLKSQDLFFNSNKSIANKKPSFYVTKCSLIPNKFFSYFKDIKRIKKLNNHIRYKKKKYKKGLILVSDSNLTSKKYYKLQKHQLKSIYPRNFHKLVRKLRCN